LGLTDASASVVISAKAGIQLLINNLLNRRNWTPAFVLCSGENAGEKVCHGSGGVIPRRSA